jgi:hypothetical protein
MSRKVGAPRRNETSSLLFLSYANSGWSSSDVTVPQALVEPLGPSTPAEMNSWRFIVLHILC